MRVRIRTTISILGMIAALVPTFAQKKATKAFGESYAMLRPEQKKLVDEYVMHYNQASGSKVVPQAAYDAARMSVRTKFDAVTHALLTAKITDAMAMRVPCLVRPVPPLRPASIARSMAPRRSNRPRRQSSRHRLPSRPHRPSRRAAAGGSASWNKASGRTDRRLAAPPNHGIYSADKPGMPWHADKKAEKREESP